MDTFDCLFFHPNSWSRLTSAERESILVHVIGKLNDSLDCHLVPDWPLSDSVDRYIAFDLRSMSKPNFLLDIRYRCIISMIQNMEEELPSFGATVFAYSRGSRLVTAGSADFFDLDYFIVDGTPRWNFTGWFKDEYGEYEQYSSWE